MAGFFEDDVFAGLGRAEELRGVLIRVAGDVDDVESGIGEHGVEVCMDAIGRSVAWRLSWAASIGGTTQTAMTWRCRWR